MSSTPSYSYRDWFFLAAYIIAGLIGTIGNGFIIRTVYKRRMKTTTFTLIANQAFSDMSCGIFYISLWFFCSSKMLSFGLSGLIICELILTLKTSTFAVSSITMSVISIERFLKLYYPMNRTIQPRSAIVFIWILATGAAITCMFHFRTSEFFTEKQLIGCRVGYNVDVSFFKAHYNYIITLAVGCFIPISITSYMYYKVIVKINEAQIVGKMQHEQAEAFEESKRQTTKMLIIIVLLYCIACSPVFTIWLINFFFVQILDEPCNIETKEPLYYRLAYLASVSSICLNPFIYCYYNQVFRSEARRICQKIRRMIIPKRFHTTEISGPARQAFDLHVTNSSISSSVQTSQTSMSGDYVNISKT